MLENITAAYKKMTTWKMNSVNNKSKDTIETTEDDRKLYIKIDNSKQLEFQTFISTYKFDLVEIIDYNKTTDKIQYLIFDSDLDTDHLINDLIDIFGL